MLIRLYISPHNGCKQEQQQKPPSSGGFKSRYQKLEKNEQQKKRRAEGGYRSYFGTNVGKSDHIEVHKVGQCAVCGVTLEDTEVFQPIFIAKLKYAR